MDKDLQKCCKCDWTGFQTDMKEKENGNYADMGVAAYDLVCPVCENNEFYLVK